MPCHYSIDCFDTAYLSVINIVCHCLHYVLKYTGYSLLQEECLHRLQNRIEVQYDGSNLEHQVQALADISTLLVLACNIVLEIHICSFVTVGAVMNFGFFFKFEMTMACHNMRWYT
ncbi:ELMO/CED-12 family protein [Zea mays]|jgi:hypothetical protein|uniref:ELMO/CED-12 family protein n=2 Tax=Zea mays TaxID=4577 RepID=A0A1D6E4D4_MAIZE|nr:ELMO/CED-12 family protein [Zea mays]